MSSSRAGPPSRVRPEVIAGVLLAAGRGTRFDPAGARNKLLEPLGEGAQAAAPMAVAAARTLLRVLPQLVAVVRPASDPAQAELHRALADAGCRLIVNARADEGMGTSIADGVAACANADGWLIALADMPAVQPSTVEAIVHALRGGAPTAAPFVDGRRGHPVGFSAALRDRLLALGGESGARELLQRHPPQRIDVADPGCLLDVDTRADLRRLPR